MVKISLSRRRPMLCAIFLKVVVGNVLVNILAKLSHDRICLTSILPLFWSSLWETAPPAHFMMLLGQTHVNGWSRVIVPQNGGSTSYIFPLRLGVLQWSRHLFNYWKNKKTIIEIFLILLIWNLIYIDHMKITWLWS